MNSTLEYTVDQCEAIKVDSSYAKSKFDIQLKSIDFTTDLSHWGKYSLHHCFYYVGIDVLLINRKTGGEEQLWTYPNDGVGAEEIWTGPNGKEYKAFGHFGYMGTFNVPVNVNIPRLEIENNPDLELVLHFRRSVDGRYKNKKGSVSAGRSASERRLVLQYNKENSSWGIQDPDPSKSLQSISQSSTIGHITATSIYNFEIKKNSEVMKPF